MHHQDVLLYKSLTFFTTLSKGNRSQKQLCNTDFCESKRWTEGKNNSKHLSAWKVLIDNQHFCLRRRAWVDMTSPVQTVGMTVLFSPR